MTIAKEDDDEDINPKDKIYGMAFTSTEQPTAPPKYTEQKLSFPVKKDPQAPIQAKQAGIYRLRVSVM